MLIGDGDPDKKGQKALLSRRFTKVGMATGTNKYYLSSMAVLDFAVDYTEDITT